MNQETIDVVAGLIRRDQCYLVAKRPDNTHLSGYWEFPGGKPEDGETDQQALRRELREELAIETAVEDQVYQNTHSYDARTVHLRFYDCSIPDSASPKPVECEQIQWVHVTDLHNLKFPPADQALLDTLQNRHDLTSCETDTSS